MVGNPEGQKGHHGRQKSPESEHRERENEEQKKIEKGPGREPVALDPIRAEEGEKPPAGRKVQSHIERVGIRAPSGGGKSAGTFRPSGGFKVEIAGSDFHAGSVILWIAGDELSLTVAAHRTEILTLGRVEPPDLLHGAIDAVAEGEAFAILVEPESAGDFQSLRFLQAHAAHAFLDRKWHGRVPAINGKLPPLIGKGRLRDINRRRAGDVHHAKVRLRLERDQFLLRRRFGVRSVAKFLGIIEPERIDAHGPFARAHLGFHAPGVVHHHGQRTVHGGEFPAGGQDGTDFLFAAFARDNQFHLRAQPERDAILDQRIHFDRKKILVRLLGGRVAFQPEETLRVPRGRGHRLTLQSEREHPDLAGKREALRDFVPAETTLQFVGSRGEFHGGTFVAFYDRHGCAVDFHIDRPGLASAGQGHPRFIEDRHA